MKSVIWSKIGDAPTVLSLTVIEARVVRAAVVLVGCCFIVNEV